MKNYEKKSLIMGILSIVLCWFAIGIIFSIIGIVFSVKGIKKGVKNKTKLYVGMSLSIISIVIFILLLIFVPENTDISQQRPNTNISVQENNKKEKNSENSTNETAENNDDKELSESEYIEMVEYYNKLFSEQVLVISGSKELSDVLKSGDIEKIKNDLNEEISKVETSENTLMGYSNEFYKNKTEPPFGTGIMRMLNEAQSAVTQYKIALQNLNDYVNSGDQSDLDSFNKYINKATESMDNYTDVYNSEIGNK